MKSIHADAALTELFLEAFHKSFSKNEKKTSEKKLLKVFTGKRKFIIKDGENLKFKLLFFLFLLSAFVYGAEILEVTKEGITNDFSKGEILELKVVESASIKIGNPREDSLEIHKFKAVNIGDNFLNLSIDKKNSLKLDVSETRRIDVDNDGTFDLSINLVNIRSKVATLIFKSLEDKITVLSDNTQNKTETVKVTENKTQVVENKTEEVAEKELSLNLKKNNYNLFIILGIIFILLLSLILYFIFRTR